METLLFRIKSGEEVNKHLTDDEVVEESMKKLMARWPQVRGYQWERIDGEYINILLWGDLQGHE